MKLLQSSPGISSLIATVSLALTLAAGVAFAAPHVPDTIQSEGDSPRSIDLSNAVAAPHVPDTIQSEGDSPRSIDLSNAVAVPHVPDTIQSEGKGGRSVSPTQTGSSPFQYVIVG